mgnify:FL=1
MSGIVPARVVRTSDEVWSALGELAKREGTTPDSIVQRACAKRVRKAERKARPAWAAGATLSREQGPHGHGDGAIHLDCPICEARLVKRGRLAPRLDEEGKSA